MLNKPHEIVLAVLIANGVVLALTLAVGWIAQRVTGASPRAIAAVLGTLLVVAGLLCAALSVAVLASAHIEVGAAFFVVLVFLGTASLLPVGIAALVRGRGSWPTFRAWFAHLGAAATGELPVAVKAAFVAVLVLAAWRLGSLLFSMWRLIRLQQAWGETTSSAILQAYVPLWLPYVAVLALALVAAVGLVRARPWGTWLYTTAFGLRWVAALAAGTRMAWTPVTVAYTLLDLAILWLAWRFVR